MDSPEFYSVTNVEMGKLVKAGQIFVTSLDATPRETDILTGLASIDAGEITADEITVANLNITGELVAVAETVQFAGVTNVFRMTATQVGIGVTSSQLFNEFQVGANDFSIDRSRQNIVVVNGNVVSTNLFATNTIKTTNNKFLVESGASNVVKVTGNTFSSNLTVGRQLIVGTEAPSDSDVAIFENGNVVIRDGTLQITGNVEISGNLAISEIPDYTQVNSLIVSNAVIQMATDPLNSSPFSGNDGTFDMALLMSQQSGSSNVFFGYTQSDDTVKLSRSFGSPLDKNFIMDSSNTTNLYILGDVYTQNNVGIANTSPAHSLSVGSNLYIDDTAGVSNVLYANGYGYFEGMRIGDNGLTVGNLITMDADAPIPVVVNSIIQSDGLRTTGVLPSSIANSAPEDTLSIGDVVFVNAFSGNALTINGNTVTSRLITESIRVQDFIEVEGDSGITSVANVLIHADTDGPDTASNAVTIVAGPVASNTSLINVFGARTNPNHQLIQFMTKQTERMRISSTGNVGIANTAPTDKLTVGGTVRVIGSNAFTMGTTTNYMKAYSDVSGIQTKIESRVGTGKGLNIYASTTDTMGTPKMTILETSNVGIGVSNPQGRLHTSGGTVFVNNQPLYRSAYSHLSTPLVVTNGTETNDTVSQTPVLELTREGVLNNYEAVRATFKLGKYDLTSNKSKTKMDIYLADENYNDEIDILTLRSDGRVGIGSTVPEAYLEVVSSGIGNARENSLMIHNHHGAGGAGDAIMAAQTDATQGNAFTSYIQTTNDTNPRGWSVGISGTRDFRITRNINEVSDTTNIGLYIDGSSRDVGIGTDAPRGKLEVNGDIVLGNKLSFGGLTGDEFGNTFIQEQYYDAAAGKTELVIFKGNDRSGTAAPDRIRSIAPEHIFQTYNPLTGSLDAGQIQLALADNAGIVSRAMTILRSGQVVIGEIPSSINDDTRFFVSGGLEFASGQAINFGQLNIFTASGLTTQNVLESTGDASLVFTQKPDPLLSSTEYARITNTGLIGFGTNAPSTNVHIYSGVTTNIDVLKLESPGTNTKTGIRLNTNDGYGGYVRGYTTSGTTHGIVVGGMDNAAEADGLHVIHTSNVGVGTSTPAVKFHVYNGVARVESTTSSNAIIEIKTVGGTSNILGDVSGNVYVNPSSGDTIINSNLEVTGDLNIDGKIDLGNQVAVDLGGATANTALHVGGGFISGSNQVACKRYAATFSRVDGQSKDIQLEFGNGSFYAKIVAILRRRDGGPPAPVRETSTLVLEVQGGAHDESASTGLDEPITIGTKNLFGSDTDYPWSPNVVAGTNGILITPVDPEANRQYSYDIHVELISSKNGKLIAIYTQNPGVDDFAGAELVGPNTSTNATGKNFGY